MQYLTLVRKDYINDELINKFKSYINPIKIHKEEILAKNEAIFFLIENISDEKFIEIKNDFPEIDIFLTSSRKKKKLIMFDMDSTIIENECIDEIAKYANKYEEVKKVTEEAMQGNMNFENSLKTRVALLEGLDASCLEEIYKHIIKISKDAEILCKACKENNITLALASGGFTFFTDRLKEKLGFDYSFANQLEIKNNLLTGKVIPPIFSSEDKLKKLKFLIEKLNIKKEEAMAVGDGANDLPMLKYLGENGIAYKAKKIVSKQVKNHIEFSSLKTIAFL